MARTDITLRITRIPVTDVLMMARVVISRMTNNPHFLQPAVPLLELAQAADELEGLIDSATRGSKLALAQRNDSLERMRELLVKQAWYVRAVGNGDTIVLGSSGFPLRKEPGPIGALEGPPQVKALFTGRTGSIAVRWKPVRGAYTYELFMCEEDPAQYDNWRAVCCQVRTGYQVSGLVTGRYYWFKVRACGPLGPGLFSGVARNIAA